MTYTFDELRDNLEQNIALLRQHDFEPTQNGVLWLVCGPGYTGYGDTEYQAWCDLLLDVPLANEILQDLTKTALAQKVGQLLAQKAIKAKITQVVFDRGLHKFHGRLKALAESSREGGLKF